MAQSATNTTQPIPGYNILAKIGEGGMGAVYKAEQVSMQRIVALKVLPRRLAREQEFKERFFREAKAAGRLNHPNIVGAIDANEAGGYCYIAMEYVEGEALSDRLEREGQIREAEALNLTEQIAQALAHAWQAGIIHRDVKPENFLCTPDGTTKLCDLGIAKAITDASMTGDGMALGTPRYISPEQAQGKPVDFRTDVYSLGASLYHMLSGDPPFDGPSSANIMLKHVTDPLPPLRQKAPEISSATVRLVEKMMAKDPSRRYATPEQLIEDLRRAREGSPLLAPVSRSTRNRTRALARARATTVSRRAPSGRRNRTGATRGLTAVKSKRQQTTFRLVLAALLLLLALAIAFYDRKPLQTVQPERTPMREEPMPAPVEQPSTAVSPSPAP